MTVDWGTVILLVYLAGAMVFLVPTARFFLRADGFGAHDTFDYVTAAALSLCTVWFWPAYIPGWWIIALLRAGEKTD